MNSLNATNLPDEYYNTTVVHPLGLAALCILGLAIILLPRRYAFLPLLILSCLLPSSQRIVIASLDFTFIRVLVILGWARAFARGEAAEFQRTRFDTYFIALAAALGAVGILRAPSGAMVINQLGNTVDALGMYFLARFLVRNLADLDRVVRAATLLAIASAPFVFQEWTTGRNMFSVFGGVPEFTVVREGKLRCQGAFTNAILAGCYWASLLPLIAVRWFVPGANKAVVALGAGAALFLVFACSSSTPLMGVLAVGLGAAFWPLRFKMTWVRRGLVGVLCFLQLVMGKPVYHLIARIDLVGGSTGWQRYNLIDKFLHNFREWFVLGTRSTAHWGHSMSDLTNYYVAHGVKGGILGIVLFIAVMVMAYKQIGAMVWATRERPVENRYAWALGLALFAHTLIFFAVSYFGQIIVLFYGTLGIIGSLGAAYAPATAPARARRRKARAKGDAAAPSPTGPAPAPQPPRSRLSDLLGR